MGALVESACSYDSFLIGELNLCVDKGTCADRSTFVGTKCMFRCKMRVSSKGKNEKCLAEKCMFW